MLERTNDFGSRCENATNQLQNRPTNNQVHRRQFIQSSAVGLLSIAAAGSSAIPALARGVHTFDEEKIPNVGLIGAGWYGKVDLFRMLAVADVNVVALCDVDQVMVQRAAELTAQRQRSGKLPQTYGDYRKLLENHQLDIALIGTPDHWHALPMIAACKAGADVYVQKPVGVDFVEGEAMVAAARKYNRIVQVGTQRRSTPHLLEARDKYLKTGRLGDIGVVTINSFFGGRHNIDPQVGEPPATFDYEMWCGPAPKRPFLPAMHPVKWRAFMEYGNGAIGDLCVHFFDLVRYFLDLGWPNSISSTGGILVDKTNVSTIPDTQFATFSYDNLEVIWENRAWGIPDDAAYPWAVTFHGSLGTLKLNLKQYEFIPKGSGETEKGEFLREEVSELERQEDRFDAATLGATRRHVKNFMDAVKTRELPVADILQGHISSSACVLANNAMQLGRTLQLDLTTGRPKDDEEATNKLARSYREPWIHPTAETV